MIHDAAVRHRLFTLLLFLLLGALANVAVAWGCAISSGGKLRTVVLFGIMGVTCNACVGLEQRPPCSPHTCHCLALSASTTTLD